MKAKIVENAELTTYVVVCDIGDEAVDTLTQFAISKQLTAAHMTAIGSFEHATVGWFDRAAKTYRPNLVDQQCELASLVGNVALGDDGPTLHMHAALGLPDGTTPRRPPPQGEGVPDPAGSRDRDSSQVAQGAAP